MKKLKPSIADKLGFPGFFIFLFCLNPILMNGQIKSAEMVYVMNDFYDDQIVSANELSYYGLVCDPRSQLPKAKKGKYFCQTENSKSKIGSMIVYEYTKQYYNHLCQLACVLSFTLDSTTRDTIKKSREMFCYENGLLKYIITQKLIDKVDRFSVHGDKLRNSLSLDTVYVHYDFVSNNMRKGYSYDSEDGDTSWFNYSWTKNLGSGYQLTCFGKNGDVEMQTNVNENGFYQFTAGTQNYANFVFGVFYTKDSILIQSYSGYSSSNSINQNHKHFQSISIVYDDTIARQSIRLYSRDHFGEDKGMKISKYIKYDKSKMPLWIMKIWETEDKKMHSKLFYYSYSYEKRFE